MHQHSTLILEKPFRDDVKGGAYLNKRLRRFSATDYTQYECYYIGEPIKFAIAFIEPKLMNHGYMAELALAGDGFKFNRKNIKKILALFFENRKYNNIRLQALIPTWNKQALRLAVVGGFTLEGRLRQVAKDGDRFVYSMLQEEYRALYVRNF